jgi:two-component system, chemotaxis family, CheB/CheR fusion protein
MYRNGETKSAVLRHFHVALPDSEILLLGKSEVMLSHREQFTPVDLKRRIYPASRCAARSC